MRKMFKNAALTAAFGLLSWTANAQAGIVWQDTFARGTSPTTLNPYDFTGNSTNDYVINNVTPSVAGGRLVVVDDNSAGTGTSSTTFGNMSVPATQWLSAGTGPLPAGGTITYSIDWRINSLSNITGPSVSVPRMTVQAGGSEIFTVGFGVATLNDGDASNNDLALYAIPSSTAVTFGDSTAIGLSGTTFAAGFDFGNLDTTTGTNNDTNGQFYRISLTFTQGSSSVLGTATNLGDTLQTVNFSRNLAAPFAFNNGASDWVRVLTGQGGMSSYEVDNLSVDLVPEPGSVSLLAMAAVGLLGRRRRAIR